MSFVIDEIVASRQTFSGRIYPLPRAKVLEANIARVFSRHFGNLQVGLPFESECIVLTGEAGSGKTEEVIHQMSRFCDEGILLPDGKPARIVRCLLDAKGNWKDLGIKTLHTLGYPIEKVARHTQASITAMITDHAKRSGVIGINFDEAQHILRNKSEANRHAILDSFKTLLKSHDWPLMLILTGRPELMGYVQEEPQLHRLAVHQFFPDLKLPDDLGIINEIVRSVAIESGLQVSDDVASSDLYTRLAVCGSYRWGLLIQLSIMACETAKVRKSVHLERHDFAEAWYAKVESHAGLNPFTHDAYDRLLRREHPFRLFPAA